MREQGGLGEFEQLVLLAVLRLGDDAMAAAIRSEIEVAASRTVSRGALYATLERLEGKGFLRWEMEDAVPARGGVPRRRFLATPAGVEALRRTRAAVRALARGLERVIGRA
jgi:DNA-binding PadR family transcriptional regulator